ncbi:MAG: D-alanine--D-alanine ligase [Phycisphaerae bacterium]|nr:D-alanine--D-alanine ligase [Phycisphaerae bacterium]
MKKQPIDIRKIKVAVLAGGVGSEREVSLASGANIAKALHDEGLGVIESDIAPDNLTILDDDGIDAFFLALHGQFGEDGSLQDILEKRGKVFTGSGSKASRLAFDKVASKKCFREAGVIVADEIVLNGSSTLANVEEQLARLGNRFVVKPIRQGSSVGISILEGVGRAAQAAIDCFRQYGDCLVESYIPGREFTVGILNGVALPVLEIRSRSPFYDYQAKYLADTTEYLFDTLDNAALIKRMQDDAVRCYHSLGCRHQSRVDMIVNSAGVPYILEINTLPGFTSHSLLPMAAAKAGMPIGKLCVEILRSAVQDHSTKGSRG